MEIPYKEAFVGPVWVPDSDLDQHYLYSREKLYEVLMRDEGLLEDEVGDWIDYNLTHRIEGFCLLEDD